MLQVLFLAQHFFYLSLLLFAIHEIVFKQRWIYLIVFLIFFLPNYFSLHAVIYNATGSTVLSIFWKILKEVLILFVVIMMILTARRDRIKVPRLTLVDWIYVGFLSLVLLYFILPIGPVSYINKLLYVRSILVPAAMYFIGRNMVLNQQDQNVLVIALCSLVFLTFAINFFEFSSGIHYQKLIGWAKYDFDILETEPQGYYGLGWNFERGPNSPRFAAFYSNSLEAGASTILVFASSLFLMWYAKPINNKIVFGSAILMCVFANYLAFSRAALVGLFSTLFMAAIFFRYYRLILLAGVILVFSILAVYFFADDILKFYLIDTITFRQASSLGHLLEWIRGFQVMLTDPLGIGLATSGNAAGVEEAVKVGGESQIIAYGVQMGFPGVGLYLCLLASILWVCFQVFRRANKIEDKYFPFVAGLTKFGLLLPLFTTVAENFLFLSYVSWWMVGYTVTLYQKYRNQGSIIPRSQPELDQ